MRQDTIQDCAKPLSEMTLEELWQLFPIILSGYDPDWKKYYEEEKTLLAKSFGNLLVRIEHIGSTAVEGLLAKPTVDILLETDPSASPDAVRRTADGLLPVEVKAGNTVSKSLRNLIASDHYPAIKRGIKFAHANIGKTETITTFPYFCAFLLRRYLKE